MKDGIAGWVLLGAGAVLLYQQFQKRKPQAAAMIAPPGVAPPEAMEGPPPAETGAPVSVPTAPHQGQSFEPIPEQFDDSGVSIDEIAGAAPVYQ